MTPPTDPSPRDAARRPSGDAPANVLPQEIVPVGPLPAEAVPVHAEDLLAPVLPYATSATNTWTVGTLTYTRAALLTLFVWLLWGDFALSARDRSVGPIVQLFLKQLRTTDTTFALLVSTLPPAIGLIVTPIVSYKSDRYRSRWGRRIPFLLVPTPIAFLSMVGIGYSPQIGAALYRALGGTVTATGADLITTAYQTPGLHNSILAVFAVCWTLFEVAALVSLAVIGGLINDVVPRPLLGRFYGLFRLVSLGAGMGFNFWVFGIAENHLTAIFVSVGALFGAGFTLMCLMVREGEYPPLVVKHEAAEDRMTFGPLLTIWHYFRECFGVSYYRWAFAAITLSQLSFIPFNTFSVPYAKQLSMNMGRYGTLVAASYAISLISAYPLGWLADRFHTLRVGIATMLVYVASMIYGIAFVHGTETFAVALVLHTVLSGAYFTATASMSQALLPRMKFGQFASAAGMVSSIATMLFSPLLGMSLDASNHDYRLTFVAGLLLCALAILCMWVTLRYYLNMGGRTGEFVAPGDEVQPEPRGFEVVSGRH